MHADHERLIRETVRAMGDWPVFGPVATRFLGLTVDARLRRVRISEADLCRAIYGSDGESNRHRLHTLVMNVRHRYLPEWYSGRGRFDQIRLTYPKGDDRRQGQPTYWPNLEFAFGTSMCTDYVRRHGLGHALGEHPLSPCTGPDTEALHLSVAGSLLRRDDSHILILPLTPDLTLMDTLLQALVRMPKAGDTPPPELRLRPQLIDYVVQAIGTVLLRANDGLEVTPKQREDLYLAWLFADAARRSTFPSHKTRDLFVTIPLENLQALADPPSGSVPVTDILLVDDTHASPTEIMFKDLKSELRPAIASGTNRSRTLIDNVLTSILALRGRVKRVGLVGLHDALWDGAVAAPPENIVKRYVIDFDERQRALCRVIERGGKSIVRVHVDAGDAALARAIRAATAIRKAH